jgi:23S rRNA (uracil1939-C5)-methyltransferase
VAGARAFVAGALPGETVLARSAASRAGAAVFEVEAVLAASPERVAPPCPHFGTCGGCAVQHLADAAYARWKVGLLAEALARAGFPDTPLAALARTPPGARRRADFALARARGAVRVGFHARRDTAVIDLAECTVLHPRLAALVGPLRALLADLPALRRTGSAVVTLLDAGPDLLLRTDGPIDAAQRARLAAFARTENLVRVSHDGEPVATLAAATITLAGRAVAAPAGAFLQASPQGEAAIIAGVLQHLPARVRRIADLFAGLGTLSFALAAQGRVAAFEGEAAAHAALAAAAGGSRVVAHRRDLARAPLQPAELEKFDAVVLDPPRAGAAEQSAALAQSLVPHVVYVSCAPAALARDARLLRAGGYHAVAAAPIDQFLWTPHLEAVVHFARSAVPRRS